MKALITTLLFLCCLHVASSPEDMYRIYDKNGKNRELTEKFEQMKQRLGEEKEEENAKETRILVISLIIALVPVVVVGGNVIRKQTWEENRRGTVEALATAIVGGIALFGFNYGWFYLKHLHEEVFNFILSIVFILLLIGLGFYLARKKK